MCVAAVKTEMQRGANQSLPMRYQVLDIAYDE
jgi:hypothetical protein